MSVNYLKNLSSKKLQVLKYEPAYCKKLVGDKTHSQVYKHVHASCEKKCNYMLQITKYMQTTRLELAG